MAMAHAPADPRAERDAPGLPLWKCALLAMGVSAAINAVLYLLGAALGAFPREVVVPNAGGPMTLMPVVTASVVGVLGGTAVFALLRRFVVRPVRVFVLVAVVVLFLSFVTPFTIPGAPPAMIAVLEAMHVVVAAVTVWALAKAAPR